MDLTRYFEVVFENMEINNDELKTFTEDHLRRLSANNVNDQHGVLIADTTAAYTEFFGDISDADTNAAVREGLTIRVNATQNAFFERVSRREGRIRDRWGKTAPEYQEFFPRGLSEYSSATLGDAERLMNQFTSAAKAHITELGQAFHDEFAALRQAFLTARTAQLGKKGAVSSSQNDAKATRSALEKRLSVNLLLLAAQNIGDTGQCAVYFDQSIIRPQQKKQDETTPTAP